MISDRSPFGLPLSATDGEPTPLFDRTSASRGQMTEAFDLDAALAEIPGGFETALDLASLFLDECPSVLRQIRDAMRDGNPRVVRRGAHTLKSSAAIFAAHGMVEAASRLERLASEGHTTALAEPLADLEREAALVMDGLRRLCAGG